LATVLAGERFEYGGVHSLENPTRAEAAFALLDHAVFCLLWKLEGNDD